jgi:predicted nucleic acid-binding protein
MIIADTNLLVYLYFETVYSEETSLIHELDYKWAAPVLWRSEFVNVISHYLRKKIINYSYGLEAIDSASRLIGDNEYSVSQYSVLELVNQSNCSSYDCEFVALAKEMNLPLVTYDKKILSEFPSIAINAKDFLKQSKSK